MPYFTQILLHIDMTESIDNGVLFTMESTIKRSKIILKIMCLPQMRESNLGTI